MSLLFEIEGKVVSPKTEVLLIYPFSLIWERDESPDKSYAIEDFSYIEFMGSMKKTNPYSGYAPDVRKDKIIRDVITRSNWEPDPIIMQGIAKLEEFQTEASVTYSYYIAAREAAERMKKFFKSFDLSRMNPKTGNPLYKPRDITSSLNDTAKVLENLDNLKEKVDNEIFETVKNKGQKTVSPFANPNTL
jgi:hypothetical protein